MAQIIPICIGNAGIKSSDLLWQLIGLQQRIGVDGVLNKEQEKNMGEPSILSAFYHETSSNKFKLNAMCIDTDQQSIDSLRTGPHRDLYEAVNLVSGKQKSNGLFCKGYYEGNELVEICMDPIRKAIEGSESFGGFMMVNGTSGGAGSGISSRMLSRLSQQYNKNERLCISIYPESDLCPKSAYNTLLSTHNLSKHADISVVLDNETLTTICQSELNIKVPKYNDLNQLIAYSMSYFTYGLRHQATTNSSLQQIAKNMIFEPRFKFLLTSFSPFTKVSHEDDPSTREITLDLFRNRNILADCSLEDGKMLDMCLVYHGNIIPKEVGPGMVAAKSNKAIQLTDFCSMRCGISYKNPTFFEDSIIPPSTRVAYGIFNCSSVKHMLHRVIENFKESYGQKSNVSEYLEGGVSVEDFEEALEGLVGLCDDYEEVEKEEDLGASAMPEGG